MLTQTRHPWKRAPLALAFSIAVALVLVATGCGESKSDKEAGRYADSFCTNVSTWEQQVGGIASTLGAGSPKAVAQTKLTQAATATTTLVARIHALPVPDVDGADEAKQDVDQFASDSLTTVTTLRGAVKYIQSRGTDATVVATAAVPAALQVANLVSEGKSTTESLKKIKGPFERAFKKSEACKKLNPNQDES